MAGVIELERVYPQAPERVWQAITNPEALEAWLAPNDFAPRVGHRFQFTMEPRPGFDGIIRCEVLTVEPPRQLVYAWSGAWGSEDTRVTWVLEPEGSGTRVRLRHEGFVGIKGAILRLMMSRGWGTILRDRVATWLDTKSVSGQAPRAAM